MIMLSIILRLRLNKESILEQTKDIPLTLSIYPEALNQGLYSLYQKTETPLSLDQQRIRLYYYRLRSVRYRSKPQYQHFSALRRYYTVFGRHQTTRAINVSSSRLRFYLKRAIINSISIISAAALTDYICTAATKKVRRRIVNLSNTY